MTVRVENARHEHYSVDFHENDEGWWHGRCVCGWDGGVYPTAEDAADALIDHAYQAGLQAGRHWDTFPEHVP